MLSRLAFVCKRVLTKCGFNCFKAAEHRGDSREEFDYDNLPIGILKEDGTIEKTNYLYKNIHEFLFEYYPAYRGLVLNGHHQN